MDKTSSSEKVFAMRLKAARKAAKLPQDKLGVMIGLDEGCSSARMSRYESGIHSPDFETAMKLGKILNVPTAYFYCEDEKMADFLVLFYRAPVAAKEMTYNYLRTLIA